MPRNARSRRQRLTVRPWVTALAVAIMAAGMVLAVVGHSVKQVQIGLLVGLWGLLLAWFTGTRPRSHEPAGTGLELRKTGELDTQHDAQERRAFEKRLEQLLRQDQAELRSQLAHLQDEVAGLRRDVVEKVGGQLRLERIETTRVIGSDIEALQHEVRRLAHGRKEFDLDHLSGPLPILTSMTVPAAGPPAPTPRPAPVPPPVTAPTPAPVSYPAMANGSHSDPLRTSDEPLYGSGAGQDAESTSVLPRIPAAGPSPVVPAPPAPAFEAPPAPAFEAPPAPAFEAPPAAAPVVPAPVVPAPVAPAPFDVDPFAGLPRLSRFVDDEPEPVPAGHSAAEHAPGRRHATDDDAGTPVVTRTGGGRRRRADDEPSEILERLLGR